MKEENKKNSDKKKALKPSKHYRGWYAFLREVLRPIGRILMPRTVIGLENLPLDEKYILAGNHRSWIDLPLVAFGIPGYRHYIAKDEFLEKAISRWLFSKIGVFTVNREAADIALMHNVLKTLNRGETVAIFPEGTRNKSSEDSMLELKEGIAFFAYKTGAPILPFIIYRKPKLFRRSYMYIGPAFSVVDGPQKGVVDKVRLQECSEIIKQKFSETFTALEEIVNNNAIKKVRKERRLAVKENKKLRKLYKKKVAKNKAKTGKTAK